MRFRHSFIFGGSIVVLFALLATDPNQGWLTLPLGASVVAWLLQLARFFVLLLCVHFGRKALCDYPEADMRLLFHVARQSPAGAGLGLVALAVIILALSLLVSSTAHAAVPDRARLYLPELAAQVDRHWPAVPVRHYPAGLIEHETGCPSMPTKCWAPTSRLKSAREEGAGLGQLTRAWRADGSLRFDALAELRDKHPALRSLSWADIYTKPDHQLAALVLKLRDDYAALGEVTDPMQRLAMADAAYNGGIGGVRNERRACGLTAGCDPGRWFGHVERHCLKSRAALYGNRSACDINRHHVRDVIITRVPRYLGLV